MIYLVFSSEFDYSDAAKYLVAAWDTWAGAANNVHELAAENWGRYRFWWITSTKLADPYNSTTELVKTPKGGC